MRSLMAPLNLTLSDPERSKSRSFTYWVVEERYVVIYIYIYILVVVVDFYWTCRM